ncbi:MAG: FmdB family transcriptional regulator [Chitinivibrionales bacterium]|nr:FmdB family transcriptional regulator [Chitinivibrionales bacterium]
MPTYEYKCATCGYYFEKFQRITEDPITACPKEGCSGTVNRIISRGAAVIFKGSGFYQTDYRSESYKKAVSADSSEKSSTSSEKSSTSEKSTPSIDKSASTSEKKN